MSGEKVPKRKRHGIARVTTFGSAKTKSPPFQRDDGIRVEERLQLPHLEQLLHWFQNHEPPTTPEGSINSTDFQFYTPKKPKREAGLLTPEEFKETLVKVLGTHDYDDQLDNLFTRLDTTCDGYVDWNEFCTYMLLQFRENDYMRAKKQIPFQAEAKIRHSVHNRQETTTKVVAVENPTKYVTVSKEGAIMVWDPALHFERCYSLTEREDNHQSHRRRVKEWVSDMVSMPNSHKLAISSTGRDIRFFDATSTQYFEEFYLYGLPNVPTCMNYWFDRENPGHESVLLYGDDHGAINLLYFLRPLMQLFASPFKKEEGVQRVFFKDLQLHSRWVRHQRLEDIHNDPIRKVIYMPENDCVISSSGSSKNSLVIMDIQRKKKTYVFKLNKGVDCFDYNKNLNLLVTGSTDHLVRIWNPYVTWPIAKLEGHSMAIVDIKIHEALNQIFSLSRDTVLKVWDVKEHSCLQTVLIKFPSSLLGRLPDYGPFPMHLQPSPQNSLLITANDYIAQLKVGQGGITASKVPTTHMTQLCCALYNPLFKQVVTAADDSTIAVWELETGSKCMLFTNAHGKEEITCLAFDNTWRRLISGARNGTIKIWNFQNGHNLHNLESVSEAEVTGVTPVPDKKLTLAVGWSRMIIKYHTSDQDLMNVKADTSWKAGHIHKEDIVASAYSPSLSLFVSASFDGEICVWSLEKESLYCHLRRAPQPKCNGSGTLPSIHPLRSTSGSTVASRASSSRPNSRHRKTHRPPPGEPAPVDKVLFLQTRCKVKRTEAAILISSEAGVLHWWSVFGTKKELGYFYAPLDHKDESVLGLCSNLDDTQLVSGDTKGAVSIWDISNFCLLPEKHRVKQPPPLVHSWIAHEAAVVSVEIATHSDCGDFILTASTDKSAKLWDMSGRCVGCFGQKAAWNLRDEMTWKDAPPVCSDEEGEEILSEDEQEAEKVLDGGLERGDTLGTLPDAANEEIQHSEKELELELQKEYEEVETLLEDGIQMPKLIKAHTVCNGAKYDEPSTDISSIHHSDLNACMERSRTLGHFSLSSVKSLLGQSVDKHLARRTADRQFRRDHYGDVEFKQTNKIGKLCCPYQVLATKDLTDIKLSGNLPLTSKMQSQGMTPASLTLDNLRQMNLREYSDPSTDQPHSKLPKKSNLPKEADEKDTKLPAIRSLRKSQTYAASNNVTSKTSDFRKKHPLSAAPITS